MYYEIPLPPFPIAFGMCGVLAGLLGGGCSQMFPVWVGAATGASVGCAVSIFLMLKPDAQTPVVAANPVVVENIYLPGQPKDPVANGESL